MTTRRRLTVPIGDVRPYERNPRHNDGAVDAVKASIEEFGFRGCILVDASMTIIAGHTRLKAAKALGMTEVPVEIADDLTEEQVKALRLVDNRTGELSEWDYELLFDEVSEMEYDMTTWFPDLDFSDPDFDNLRAMTRDDSQEYQEFVDKFKPVSTTDDCITPTEVYEIVADWVSQRYGISRDRMVRPFYPGGDYQHFEYPKDAVVVDNPPFSIMAEILRYYLEKGIPFFLFNSALVAFNALHMEGLCAVVVGVSIVYDNGAEVNTSFYTSLEKGNRVITAPDLTAKLDEVRPRVNLVKLDYPANVTSGARLGKVASIPLEIPTAESAYIRTLDSMETRGIYGGGILVSDRIAAEIKAAEIKAAAPVEVYTLSPREREIVEELNRHARE